jgi:hypothetical protein
MSHTTQTHVTRTQYWTDLIAEFERSQLSAKAFSEKNNILPGTLHWWRRRLKKINTSFIEVKLHTLTTPPSNLKIIFQRRNIALDIPSGADLLWVRAVVDALT